MLNLDEGKAFSDLSVDKAFLPPVDTGKYINGRDGHFAGPTHMTIMVQLNYHGRTHIVLGFHTINKNDPV